MLVVPGYLKLD